MPDTAYAVREAVAVPGAGHRARTQIGYDRTDPGPVIAQPVEPAAAVERVVATAQDEAFVRRAAGDVIGQIGAPHFPHRARRHRLAIPEAIVGDGARGEVHLRPDRRVDEREVK